MTDFLDIVKKEHFEKFGVDAVLIGYKGTPLDTAERIENSIEKNKPYDEYKMLSKDDRLLYDKGELCL